MLNQNVHAPIWAIIKTLIVPIAVLVGLFLFGNTQVSATSDTTVAHENTSSETTATDSVNDDDVAVIPDVYRYVVQPLDNMSKLTRRSITLYDEGNDSMELTQAQVIFVETNVVQDLGPKLLDIDESFEVSREMIEKYTVLAPGLSETTQAAWDNYASTATFELADMTPLNVPLNDDGSLDTDYAPPTVQDTTQQPTETSSTPTYWWTIGIVALLVVSVVLWPKQNRK